MIDVAYTKIWPIKGSASQNGMLISRVIKYDKDEKKTSYKTESKTFGTSEISNVINYTSNASKTDEQKYVSTVNCTVNYCIEEMLSTKKRYGERGNRILYHAVQSFKPGEIDRNDPKLAHELGVRLAKELWGDRFEVVITTHLDREHIHNHFAINSVSFLDGKKFDWDKEYIRMRDLSDRLCREHMLSVIEAKGSEGMVHRGVVRADEEGRYTLEKIVKEDIDACIMCAGNLDEWFHLMRDKGYRINTEGKYLKVFPYGHKKCIRVDRRFLAKYGMDYSLTGIAEMIAEHRSSRMNEIGSNGFGKDEENYIPDTGYVVEKVPVLERESEEFTDGKLFREYGFRMPKKVRGLQKNYNRYLYLLGVHPAVTPRRIARTHFLLREDLLKLDRLIGENNLLISRNITDMDKLEEVTGVEADKLKDMCSSRDKLRNRIRRASSGKLEKMRQELAALNEAVRKQRKTVFYLKDIKETLKAMDRKIVMYERLREEETREKTDKSNREYNR